MLSLGWNSKIAMRLPRKLSNLLRRSVRTSPGNADGSVVVPAALPARFAAFCLDLLLVGSATILCAVAAWLLLLLASAGGTEQPSDAVIYLAVAIGSAWLPGWGAYAVIAWSGSGQTYGFTAMSLQVADRGGRSPHPARALVRLLVLVVTVVPLLLAPAACVALVAAMANGTTPTAAVAAAAIVLLLAAASPVCCLLTADRRALHDVAARTQVRKVGSGR